MANERWYGQFYIGHLHVAERQRIRDGNFNPQEREMLANGKDPWEKFRNPLPADLQPPGEEPKPPIVADTLLGKGQDSTLQEQLEAFHSLVNDPDEIRRAELLRFMPKQLRAEYEKADLKRKVALWEANERNFEAAEKREQQRLQWYQEKTEKTLDLLHQLQEDPNEAHLLPPDDASMDDLHKWHDEMSKPVRVVPFPGEGGYDVDSNSRQSKPDRPEAQKATSDIESKPQATHEIEPSTGHDKQLEESTVSGARPMPPSPIELSKWSVRIQRGALFVAAGIAWWLFEKFDAPVWLALITLIVCLVSVVLVRWLEKTKARQNLFLLFLVLYVLFAVLAAIRFRDPTASTVPNQRSSPKVDGKQTENDQNEGVSDVDPAYLVGLYKKYNSAQADEAVRTYIGKRIKVSGIVSDVAREKDSHDRESARIVLSIQRADGWTLYAVIAEFTEPRWIDRVVVLNRGETVTVEGKLFSIGQSGISLRASKLVE